MAEWVQGQFLRGRDLRGYWLKYVLLVLAALIIGWWAHGARPVQAASSGDLEFQMQGTDLLV